MMRRAVAALIFGYAIALVVLFVGMEVAGERFWPLAVLLYLPQWIFLLPLLVLAPAALLAEVSLGAYAALAGCVIIFLWHVPFFPGISGSPSLLALKVMTNNYGQNHGHSIKPFIDAQDPDVAALEDAAGQGPVFQRLYPKRTVVALGQFILISKLPVTSARLLDQPRWRGMPVAAVYEVPWKGEYMAIYAVHLPTPRGDFAKLAGLGLLRELAGDNRRRSDGMSFAEAMTARVELARGMSGVFTRERRPFIAMGDFNMPSDGCVHRVITSGLTDCFEKVGRGFGFTFPCDTNNPLTLGGPWLRLDYILADRGWHVENFEIEPERRSEHHAVVATMDRN
jgi:endonuclease/exonuclease/phosphatase family metal-dependent hydrolase